MELIASAPSLFVLVLPTTAGAQDVTVYGLVALKLTRSVRARVWLPCLMELKLPTAYMVPPHWAIWRTCCVGLDVAGRWGVLLAGGGGATPPGRGGGAGARPAARRPQRAPPPPLGGG